MKKIAHQFSNKAALILAAVVFLVTIGLVGGLSQVEGVDALPLSLKGIKANNVESLEARIESLHQKLMITQAQEEQWNKVTEVIRQNAQTMTMLLGRIKFHEANAGTPVDEIKFYGQIAEAHANSIKKLIPVFETLYNSLSENQKKALNETSVVF